ncbi:CDP-6-deoxy-delta-3,4-glucoseen reductase [Halopseudomonas oceani]|uniref:DNA lesion error-prone repair protein ImuA n=1 Tax=Halopseudomonas oceani TaxID=1708783 RepID=A0A2P4EYU7_9GAMM|nr:translesion DNA synthesis-associated protein ImuA [Halopseudomonas oceani]POB05658.1 DNA lesion error-prone repair protein ImuA [Halopseudomonas oceani]GGE41200.1 CDP-6-deoxy-delta-3,4-glucoseen reductase [Halopseudomonas oceani]
MGAVVALDRLLETRRVWRGRQQSEPVAEQPTGHAQLDAVLPGGGWQLAALNEILLGQPGSGEQQLLWPLLARLTQAGERVVLVGAPAIPFAPAWQAAGVVLAQVSLLQVSGAERLWAAEQCLRSGSCGAVLCWPEQADDRALRRLQVAADSGQALAFVLRHRRAADNPSPAALRLLLDNQPRQWRVLKCRGGVPPARPVPAAF